MRLMYKSSEEAVLTDPDLDRSIASCPVCGGVRVCRLGTLRGAGGEIVVELYSCHTCERDITLVQDDLADKLAGG